MLDVRLMSYIQVSAFSTWDKELHKIVFDPRYLLLNPKERKQVQFLCFCLLHYCHSLSSPDSIACLQYCAVYLPPSVILCFCPLQVFDQYVKTRAEEERKEKKNKLMQAKDEFRRMMEEAKFTPR